MHVDPPYAPAV
jgi:hypothetical protein